MAVAENAWAKIGSSNQNLEGSLVSSDNTGPDAVEKSKQTTDFSSNGVDTPDSGDQDVELLPQQDGAQDTSSVAKVAQMQIGLDSNDVQNQHTSGKNGAYGINQISNGVRDGADGDENFKRDIRDLAELLSKLNPMAEEFVPPSYVKSQGYFGAAAGAFGYANNFILQTDLGNPNGTANRRRRNGYNQGKRRLYHKIDTEEREEMIRRTVYVSDIDQQVTEEQLAALFLNCGQVVDCRVCGDPNSILRFAFIEFTNEDGARAALSLSGTMLGYYPVRVLPSKTAIAPVNPSFLPRSEDEREMCSRTIYCTNIDKKVTQADVKLFFESLCGEVERLRLLGDFHHSTRIAFVEFTMAENAIAALNCSGVVLGSLPIRVSPSKTPVKSRAPRPSMH